jgi:alkanesulfonate monooxygenase SsuD/methylene tetrahydromethanopterin reductase-like flavin-dependent oxidoreductase (luciferase family)
VIDLGWRVPMWPAEDYPAARLVEEIEAHLARLAGTFQSAWLSDHFVPGNDWRDPRTDTLEAWSTICHLAAAFPSYRYGHVVLASSYRQPALLAKMAATTQLLTRGRLILGIGAGWKEDEYRAYGYEFPPAKVRIGQLSEAIQIIRAMWTRAPASFAGRYFRIADAWNNPLPDPPPPIMVGGGGERLTLRVVAEHADWWNLPGGTPESYQHKLDVLAEHCRAVDRDPATIELSWETGCVAIAPTRAEAERIARASPFHRAGGAGSSVVGEPEEVADHLRRYVELGVRHFVLRFGDFPRLAGAELFAERVAPLLDER